METKITWNRKKFQDLSKIELYRIMELRQEVFIVEQNCAYLDADKLDFKSFHLMGCNGYNDLLAYARILPPGLAYPEVSIGRILTSQKIRRMGYGKILMEKALNEIQLIYGNIPIKIQAQTYLNEFYKNFGFESVSESYIYDNIPHTDMIRK